MVENVTIGTDKKLLISIEPVNGYQIPSERITVEYFCSESSIVTLPGDKLAYSEDDDAYIVPVYTSKVGCGKLKCRVTVLLDDEAFEDGTRSEIYEFITGINIIPKLK